MSIEAQKFKTDKFDSVLFVPSVKSIKFCIKSSIDAELAKLGSKYAIDPYIWRHVFWPIRLCVQSFVSENIIEVVRERVSKCKMNQLH